MLIRKKWLKLISVLTSVLILSQLFGGMVFASTVSQSTVYKYAGSSANVKVDEYSIPWGALDKITMDDNICASVGLGPNAYSDYLVASDFGFSTVDIPTDAEITGIEVIIKKGYGNPPGIKDYSVRLVDANGSLVGVDQAKTDVVWSNIYSSGLVPTTYGGSGILWGLDSISLSDITSDKFGVAISAVNSDNTVYDWASAFVDCISMKIYYTASHATPTLLVTNTVTYNGSPQAAIVTAGSVSGVVSDIRYDGSTTVPTAAGTYAVTADFAPTDTATYNTLNDASAGNFTITPITPMLWVTNPTVTYNGSPQAATVSAGSVSGVVSNVCYDGATIVPTAVGTYVVTADFTPTDTTNYNTIYNEIAGSFVIAASVSHTVTLLASPDSCGNVSGGGTFAEGSRVAVTAQANPGYVFISWTQGSTIVSTSSTYRFNMGTSDCTLIANFQVNSFWPKSVRVTASSITATSVTLNLSQNVTNAESYIIYYGSKSQVFTDPDVINMTITDLDPNTSYTFTVQAVIGGKETADGPSKKIKTKR